MATTMIPTLPTEQLQAGYASTGGQPQDGNAGKQPPPTAQDYGKNNEQLPEELRTALAKLRDKAIEDNRIARRREVQKIVQARLFWKGQQHAWWSEREGTWYLPTERRPDGEDDRLPEFMYATNVYQANGIIFMAAITQLPLKSRMWPQSPEQPQDVATAKEAQKVVDLVHRNNAMDLKRIDVAFYLWCDGALGGYVRYVVDGERFGFHPEDELEEQQVPIGEDMYQCSECGEQVPVSEAVWGMCPNCAAPLSDANLVPAPMATVPRTKATQQMANGQEVLDIVGALELERPLWCKAQHEFPWLAWHIEVHSASLKSAYPHVAAQIGKDTGGKGDTYERNARLRLSATPGSLYSYGYNSQRGAGQNERLITFSRYWIRPRYFAELEDEAIRKQLQELFPQGAYVAYAGDVYCESRNEGMDDKWAVLTGLPGEGQAREAIGSSLIPAQEMLNDCVNIEFETHEHGIPMTYYDSKVIDREAIKEQAALPGDNVPVLKRAGEAIENHFYTTEPARVSEQMVRFRDWLFGPAAQFLTGNQPALFGGEIGKTLGEYAMAREQAMGRLGLVWQPMKQFFARVDLLGVECFRKNRAKDVEIPLFGEGKDFTSDWVRLANLRGNLVAFPEIDAQYPTTQSQERALLLRLLEQPNEALQAMLQAPENLETFIRTVGLPSFKAPGDDARTKQFREIEQLLKEQPVPQLGQDGAEMLLPSIVPDELTDNHPIELATCLTWINSSAGQDAKMKNPAGFANVRAHTQAHEQILKFKTLQAAMVGKGVEEAAPPVEKESDLGEQPPEPPSPEAPGTTVQ